MDAARWKQVDDVLQSVLDRAPEERDAFLRQACVGDETLEREVRSLLTSEEPAGSFLENPALEVAARALARHQREDAFGPNVKRTGIVGQSKVPERAACLQNRSDATVRYVHSYNRWI